MGEPLIPSAMTEERLLLMQSRAEKLEPIARPEDQPGVTATIKRRHAKVALDGHNVKACAVGQGSKSKTQTTKFANYDDDGDEIERIGEFTLLDRYLDCVRDLKGPITAAGKKALADYVRSRRKKRTLVDDS